LGIVKILDQRVFGKIAIDLDEVFTRRQPSKGIVSDPDSNSTMTSQGRKRSAAGRPALRGIWIAAWGSPIVQKTCLYSSLYLFSYSFSFSTDVPSTRGKSDRALTVFLRLTFSNSFFQINLKLR
jgi:hypothetical protein